jgi:hypothetical protein
VPGRKVIHPLDSCWTLTLVCMALSPLEDHASLHGQNPGGLLLTPFIGGINDEHEESRKCFLTLVGFLQ